MSLSNNRGFVPRDGQRTNMTVSQTLVSSRLVNATTIKTVSLEAQTGAIDELTVSDVDLNTLTKNGTTLSWPPVDGAAGSVMTTDGAGHLAFLPSPSGSGNVSTALPFPTDNRLVRTDVATSPFNVQPSGVQLDDANNLSGINTITAVSYVGSITSAQNFTGALSGDVTGTQSATAVALVGGLSATNVASGASAANAATSSNVANRIVSRDASGNFSAGTIAADLVGNAATATNAVSFSGALVGDVIGNQTSTVVSQVGGASASSVATGSALANASTSANTSNRIVRRDASGNFSAGSVTANLIGNASTATTAGAFSGSLAGDVTGNQSSTVVAFVGGQPASSVAAGSVLANDSTSADVAGTVVRRDGSGNFAAGAITASLNGNATSANNFSGSLAGDVTGTQSATVVSSVGGTSASAVSSGANAANAATASNVASTIVKRDGSGNFAAGTITATLNGSASSAGLFTGSLLGDVVGTQSATVVAFVGGQSASAVASGAAAANAATNSNAPSTIIKRDASGNFSMGVATGNLLGNASSATAANVAVNFSGSLVGDVVGTQSATVVSAVGGQTAANVASATVAANAATSTNTPSTIVKRDALGNFQAGVVTANLVGNVTGNLIGNASTATTSTTATNFIGTLSGDVSGAQSTTVVNSVGGQTAAAVASGVAIANAASSTNNPSAVVRRDAGGNFVASTVTANLVGNVVGNLSGNATTATNATSATSAASFTGALVGDVTGTQASTVVSTVGGQSAFNVASATLLANAATASNNPSAIVRRDASGNFAANRVTVNAVPVAGTEAASKQYVDTVAASGLVAHAPALAVATANVASLSGPQTIDAVPLVSGDRVLLVAQASAIDNGLWDVQAAAWTRPTDFANGTTAGAAYVLILQGAVNSGSSWLCTTPTAVIGTNPIAFAQFSLPSTTTGANVGTGAGEVFRDKTGVTLNFKTLANSSPGALVANPSGHVLIDNDADVVNLATDATSSNVADSIVSRDASGGFSAGTVIASLTGAASLNVLKSGDSMTGALQMTLQNALRFSSAANLNTVGLRAPATISSTYQVDLPAAPPTTGQFLIATSPTATTWATVGGSPTTTRMVFVSKVGSDSNSGTFNSPFLTISHAVSVANGLASLFNPIMIVVTAGVFVEDNSGGPIAVTASGISLVSWSLFATVISPSDPTQTLFALTTGNVEISNLIFFSFVPSTAAALTMTATSGTSLFQNVTVVGFQTGMSFSYPGGGLQPIVLVKSSNLADNGIGISAMDVFLIFDACLVGTQTGSPTSNTGLQVSGTETFLIVVATVFQLLSNGVIVNGAGIETLFSSTSFVDCDAGMTLRGGSANILNACTFHGGFPSSVMFFATDAGTTVNAEACSFDGDDHTGAHQAIAIRVTNQASVQVDSTPVVDCILGIQCGQVGDTATTELLLNGVNIGLCDAHIQQLGSSKLSFFAGTFDRSLTTISNATNVNFAAFDIANGNLIIGSAADDSGHDVYEIFTSSTLPVLPALQYRSNFYGFKGTVYTDSTAGNSTATGVQSVDSSSTSVVLTGNRLADASLRLWSDAGNVNNPDNLRGWTVSKLGTLPNSLSFAYQNDDSSGLALRGLNPVSIFNGFDNQLEFPVATVSPLPTNTVAKLVWAGDTNLYRLSSGLLRSDGNFQLGGLAASRAVATDSSSTLVASTTTSTELGFLSGTTSNVQTQLDAKLPTSGGTLTGTLTLPAGTAVLPSLLFVGSSSGTGLSAPAANQLSLSTSGIQRLSVDAAGVVTISNLGGTAGLVHSSAIGLLSNSLVVGADVASNTLPDSKLQPILTTGKVLNSATTATSVNTPNAIVTRDASGNFSAGTVTATLNGSASSATSFTGSLAGDVTGTQSSTAVAFVGGQTATNVASATVSANAATNANTPSAIVKRDASGNFSAGVVTASLNGNATTATTAVGFSGALAGDVTGTQAATTVAAVGGQSAANVASATTAANSATNANVASTIVKRDVSGNFSAGTITAALNGNAATATSAGTFSGSLSGDVTGTQSSTVVASVGGQTAANVASASVSANAATNLNTASTIVKRDGSGNFAAGTITASLNGNATTATSFTGSLSGDVTGTQSATQVALVGGQTASAVATGTLIANAATSANTASAVARRDASGNFVAGTITASLNGNATSATTSGSATNFTGSLAGDVTGTQSATVVASVGGQTASNVATGTQLANAATASNTASTIVRRDASGNFVAGTITANLSGNATTATSAASATNFTGSLSGDVIGNQGSTVVAFVGGFSSANVASATSTTLSATNSNIPSTLVKRDAVGNFSAGTVTANLSGNATSATTAVNFSGSLAGDVTGTQSSTTVATVGGQTASAVATATQLANAATASNTASTIVRRDASGNFVAGTITASLNGNATTATSATNFTGSLAGDVTGTQSSTTVATVGGQTASAVAAGTQLANAATASNTASTIVRRDASSNFVAGTITASLNGNATTATTATNFSGSLAGDVTGTQSSTTVATVGGQTASAVATGTQIANAATSSNTASAVVRRDASGNFSAGTISATLSGTASAANALNTTTVPVNVSSAIAPTLGQVLTATSGTTATWQAPSAGSITYQIATAVLSTSTSSLVDVLMSGMTLTPPSGTYQVMFSTTGTLSVGNQFMTVSVYFGGVKATYSNNTIQPSTAARAQMFGTQAVGTVNGSQAIEIRWNVSSGTATVTERSLIVVRLGP